MEKFETLVGIIVDKLGVEAKQVTPEAKFIDDLGADSLDLFELSMAMEEAFEVEIGSDELEKIVTVQDALNYLG